MLELHYMPGGASMTPHALLLDLGLPHRLCLVDRAAAAHKAPAYLALNPNGLVPMLVDTAGSPPLVLYETLAIVLHLCDTHPDAGLAPPVGTAERAEFYKWGVWMSASLQAQMPIYFYSERYVAPGHAAAAAEVKAAAQDRIAALVDQIEAQFARHGGPWLLGPRFSALDYYAFMLCRWTRSMARPARTLPHTGAFLQRMLARPTLPRVFEIEGLSAPWV